MMEARVKARRLVLVLGAVLAVLAAVLVPLAVTGTHATLHATAPGVPAATPVRICGQPILDSPWNYDGAAGPYRSGTAGLPTYGAPGTDFPAARAGLVVPAGNNTAAAHDGSYQVDHTVLYFEPGVHKIETHMYAGNNSDYVGGYDSAGGKAVITGVDGATDGTGVGASYLVTEEPRSSGSSQIGNTWEYLTVEDYGASVNDSVMGNVTGAGPSDGDTYKYDTIGPNEYGYAGNDNPPALSTTSDPGKGGGYAIDLGSYTTIEYDCITHNAQGGFNGIGGIDDVIASNEISWNGLGVYPDTSGTGASPDACGCSGGGKLFLTVNADVVKNYVHDNYNQGIWFDFDNTGMLISHNYVADNWSIGIMVEASYNGDIADNYLTGNGWASDGPWPAGVGGGTCYDGYSCTLGGGAGSRGFPFGAVYLPNTSGDANLSQVSIPSSIAVPGCSSDCTVTSRYAGHFYVQGNVLDDNFGGVVVYTDTNRYPGNLDNDSTCSQPLGALYQANSTTYYLQTYELVTDAGTSISGTTVGSPGGTHTLCSPYGEHNRSFADWSEAPRPATAGMDVFDESTGKLVGTVASKASSATSFTLAAAPSVGSYKTGDALVLSEKGGCGPADYYGGGPGTESGTPPAYYWDNCIWGARNITISGNKFSIDASVIPTCTAESMCGANAAIADQPGVPSLMEFFHSYLSLTPKASGGLGNVFSDNSYTWTGGGPGSWRFDAGQQNTFVSRSTWQNTDGQDSGSTFGS